jgi:hypothetical protein
MFAEDKRLAPSTCEEFEMKRVDFVFPERIHGNTERRQWIIDRNNDDQTVGEIRTGPAPRMLEAVTSPLHPRTTRHVLLFEKYAGSFDTHKECEAFAKGVQEVLNHMVSMPEREAAQRRAISEKKKIKKKVAPSHVRAPEL